MDGCVVQYVVANLWFPMYGLIILSPCATLAAMLSYKMQKKVTIIPPA